MSCDASEGAGHRGAVNAFLAGRWNGMVGAMSRSLLITLAFLAALPAVAEVRVSAASSLRESLSAVAAAFEGETGTDVVLSFAGSSQLARQIAAGAPVDVFFSANAAWMDDLEARGAVVAGSRVDLLSNSLVLIAPVAAEGDDPFALLGDGRVAMGLVEAVPAGIYGKAAFEKLGWWERIAPRVVQGDNVRAALRLVARGEAALGVVYATDAVVEPKVRVVWVLPDPEPPILYPVVQVRSGEEAAAFMAFLQSEAALEIFRAAGFREPE